MGLSSSQARLLTLTTRMHQIEYKAAKLESMKLQMANESTRVYEEYLDALEASKVQVKTLKSDGSASYKDISNYGDLTSAGYYLLYVADNGDMTEVSNNGEYNIGAGVFTFKSNEINQEVLSNLINSGHFILSRATGPDATKTENLTSVATDTGLQEVADEKALKKAEAKYEADMRKIDQKDRKYDQDLAALDAERNAVKSEMETLKTVAKENVERTFKLFS